jgi:hypothetical protein
MQAIKDAASKVASFFSDSSPSSSFRPQQMLRSRDHVPFVATQPPAMPKPAPTSKCDITGNRSSELIARRNQQPQRADAAVFKELFQPDTTALAQKRRKSGVFEEASRKRNTSDRREHTQHQIAHLKANLGKSGVELNLTPQPAPSTNGLLAKSKQPLEKPNTQNGNDRLHRNMPQPTSRLFSVARATFDPSTKPEASSKPKISTNPESMSTRGILFESNPQFHPANVHMQKSAANDRQRLPAIPSESFYSQHSHTNQSMSASRNVRNSVNNPVISALPVRPASDPVTPEASQPTRATRSQSKRISESAIGDQSVVIIDSDEEGVGQQSPMYASPATHSERKSLSERMIPENIIQSLKSVCKQAWLFAYPVKDSRGILSEESHAGSEAGDHFPIIPFDKNRSVAFLFFMRNGDVFIVPDDGPRDFSLPERSPQKFSLVDCASVITTLNSEEMSDAKNEFVICFTLKPNVAFTARFEICAKSPRHTHMQDDDDVVLVDDDPSSAHQQRASYSFDSTATLGDTMVIQDTESSCISVDDAKSFSALGFKLINPVFVDNRVSLHESDCRASVKRFSEFICEQIRPSGAKDSGARFSNVTSAFTHVMFGLPRSKPAHIVEDPTELLDYQIPEPEKSSVGALDPSSAASLRSKKVSLVHRVISVGDFARLDKGECLSDATIDFYSSYLRQTYPDKCRGIYFASSFFFKKLWSQLKDSKDRTDFSYMHKWNSIDIFSFNMVMFPVNLNYHWSLIVLENPAALLQPKGSGRCRLLYPDSLRTWDSQISQLFTQWITWMRMRTASPESELTPLENFVIAMLDGPKQVFFFIFNILTFVLNNMKYLF